MAQVPLPDSPSVNRNGRFDSAQEFCVLPRSGSSALHAGRVSSWPIWRPWMDERYAVGSDSTDAPTAAGVNLRRERVRDELVAAAEEEAAAIVEAARHEIEAARHDIDVTVRRAHRELLLIRAQLQDCG